MAEDGGLSGGGEVGVDDGDGAEGGHGGGHGRLRDGVHGRGNEGDGEGEAAREARGEVDGVGGEIDVVREEDDVIVGVGEALSEELIGGETVFDRRGSQVHCGGRRMEREGSARVSRFQGI